MPPVHSTMTMVQTATHRRRGLLLLGVAGFQGWLWATRAWNLIADAEEFTVAFVTVHLVLFTAAFGMAGVLAVLGWRMRVEAATAATPTAPTASAPAMADSSASE